MRTLRRALLTSVVVVASTAAQSSDPLLSDTRLTVHTLLREDVFAGFRNGNTERLAKAEQNIEVLLQARPEQRANLLAWRGGTKVFRAIRSYEAGHAADFERQYAAGMSDFDDASRLDSNTVGVAAIIGGTMATFADRVPEKYRGAAWSRAYDSYSVLWKQQGPTIEKLPVHHRGELLSGLTQSAQRTGRLDEAAQHLDRILTTLVDTPYAATAQQWKSNPASAATTNLTCKNCHNAGRLANRLEALKQ